MIKRKKDKQWSTKHYIQNKRWSDTNEKLDLIFGLVNGWSGEMQHLIRLNVVSVSSTTNPVNI